MNHSERLNCLTLDAEKVSLKIREAFPVSLPPQKVLKDKFGESDIAYLKENWPNVDSYSYEGVWEIYYFLNKKNGLKYDLAMSKIWT